MYVCTILADWFQKMSEGMGSSAKEASALNFWAISIAPNALYLYFTTINSYYTMRSSKENKKLEKCIS